MDTISSQCGEYEEDCQGKELIQFGRLTHTTTMVAVTIAPNTVFDHIKSSEVYIFLFKVDTSQ